jgi:chromate transporter
MIIVTIFAWLYVEYGQLPQAAWLLNGIQPVVIVIIIQALWLLGRKAVHGILDGLVLAANFGLYLFGINPLVLLFGCGFAYLAWAASKTIVQKNSPLPSILAWLFSSNPIPLQDSVPSLRDLFLIFFKIGATLYGSGYVLVAFLQNDFVTRTGWLTQQQLLDAVAIGQVTPGPVFTTATFIGYLLAGVPGAIVSTVAIFLPSFIFVAISNPFIPRLRSSNLMSSFLDGANLAALGLMAGVSLQLSRSLIGNPVSILIALLAAFLLFRFRVNSTWLIIGGAVLGLMSGLILNP